MLIPVIYPNGSHDLVKEFYLDYLIETKKIEKFKRTSGWVAISAKDIRSKKSRKPYYGPERRQTLLAEDEQTTEPPTIEFYKVDSLGLD
jgi:hypothetical protein